MKRLIVPLMLVLVILVGCETVSTETPTPNNITQTISANTAIASTLESEAIVVGVRTALAQTEIARSPQPQATTPALSETELAEMVEDIVQTAIAETATAQTAMAVETQTAQASASPPTPTRFFAPLPTNTLMSVLPTETATVEGACIPGEWTGCGGKPPYVTCGLDYVGFCQDDGSWTCLLDTALCHPPTSTATVTPEPPTPTP